jgi:hypothetical protein
MGAVVEIGTSGFSKQARLGWQITAGGGVGGSWVWVWVVAMGGGCCRRGTGEAGGNVEVPTEVVEVQEDVEGDADVATNTRDWHGFEKPTDKYCGLAWGTGTGWAYPTLQAKPIPTTTG